MEFEEMKLIWDSQNNEPLYAIDQEALYRKISRKGRSVTRALDFLDWLMIGMNLLVALLLLFDAFQESSPGYEYALPVVYLAIFVYALYRRFARRQEVGEFDETILGELEKAIWQADYLIRQSRSMVFWYLLPVFLVADVVLILKGNLWLALALTAVVLPLAYVGGRWEVRKWHLPKKQELEALREMLLQAEEHAA